MGGSLLTPKHIYQHASSFWACDLNQRFFFCFFHWLVFSVISFPTYHNLFLNSIVPFFHLKANQFVCFDLCLCAPRLHHIHHSLGSLPKFYVATLRVDTSGRSWRKGTEEGKGMCEREKKEKVTRKSSSQFSSQLWGLIMLLMSLRIARGEKRLRLWLSSCAYQVVLSHVAGKQKTSQSD